MRRCATGLVSAAVERSAPGGRVARGERRRRRRRRRGGGRDARAMPAAGSAGRRSRSRRRRWPCWSRPRRARSTSTSRPARRARRSATCSRTPRASPSREREPIAKPGDAADLLERGLRGPRRASSSSGPRCRSPTICAQAVFEPLGMSADARGLGRGRRPRDARTTCCGSRRELLAPTLVAPETLDEATTVQFPGLGGVIPGIGRFDPNDWGLGFELRDREAGPLDGHAGLGADVRPLRRQRHVPLGRSGPAARARSAHRSRLRRLGARSVAAPERCSDRRARPQRQE